jgi:hypothetical protein
MSPTLKKMKKYIFYTIIFSVTKIMKLKIWNTKKQLSQWHHRTLFVPCVYGCEIWSLTLREDQRLKTIHRVKKMVKLSLCLTNYTLRHEDVWGSGCIDPHFLDLGTSCRWVVSFTPLPLYPCGKSPRYSLDRRLGGPQNRSGRHGKVKVPSLTGTRSLTPWSSSP